MIDIDRAEQWLFPLLRGKRQGSKRKQKARNFHLVPMAVTLVASGKSITALPGGRASRNALLAVRHGGRGNLTDGPNVLWSMQKFLPNAPSPLLYRGVLYLIKDVGILTSVDPATGRILKQGRLPGALEVYYASPVAGAGNVYLLSHSGKMTVLKAGGQWEVSSLNDFEEDCFATPAIAGSSIYVRTRQALYCFRAPAE